MKNKIVIIRKERLLYEFHLRQRLSDLPEFYDGPGDVGEANMQEGYKYYAYPLAKELFKISGINKIVVDGFVVQVEISAAYNWQEEIKNKAKKAIKKYLKNLTGPQKVMTDVLKKFHKKGK